MKRLLRTVLVLLACSCARSGSDGSGLLLPGTPAPAHWAAGTGGTTIIWAVTPQQLITCETAAYELRSIERHRRAGLGIAIASTNANQDILREFLSKKRMTHLPLTLMSTREFRATFPGDASYMIIVRNGEVVEALRADNASLREVGFHQRLEHALSKDLQVSAQPSPTHRTRGA